MQGRPARTQGFRLALFIRCAGSWPASSAYPGPLSLRSPPPFLPAGRAMFTGQAQAQRLGRPAASSSGGHTCHTCEIPHERFVCGLAAGCTCSIARELHRRATVSLAKAFRGGRKEEALALLHDIHFAAGVCAQKARDEMRAAAAMGEKILMIHLNARLPRNPHADRLALSKGIIHGRGVRIGGMGRAPRAEETRKANRWSAAASLVQAHDKRIVLLCEYLAALCEYEMKFVSEGTANREDMQKVMGLRQLAAATPALAGGNEKWCGDWAWLTTDFRDARVHSGSGGSG